MRSPEHAPARSADLITAEMSEAFPLAGSQALEVVHMVGVLTPAAASMAAVEGIDDRIHPRFELVKIQERRECNAT